jgi:hypothetical protein
MVLRWGEPQSAGQARRQPGVHGSRFFTSETQTRVGWFHGTTTLLTTTYVVANGRSRGRRGRGVGKFATARTTRVTHGAALARAAVEVRVSSLPP